MLNNTSKNSQNPVIPQIVAGMLENDNNIEFVGVSKTQKVIFLQNGKVRKFTELPIQYFEMIKEIYIEDTNAIEFLSRITSNFNRQIELYVYYMWGDLDEIPDINVLTMTLSDSENFRESQNCPSLLWNKKNISINGEILNPRELMITDFFTENLPDKAIASNLNICPSYLDTLKKKLFTKVGVTTKPQYMMIAAQQKVVRDAI